MTAVTRGAVAVALVFLAACGGREVAEPDGIGGASGSAGAGHAGSPIAGTSGHAGFSGASHDGPPSCQLDLPGTGRNCGLNLDEDCCASFPVPGGTFLRSNKPEWPATVRAFSLDAFEVTVGRYRRFLDAFAQGWRPSPGQGALPGVPDSGWQQDFEAQNWLATDAAALRARLSCAQAYETPPFSPTWTDEPGEYERAAINCLTWAEAQAFCIWDGGRLPTNAEWSYVFSAGDEQRPFPWGSEEATAERAVMKATPNGAYVEVGSVPLGRSKWGHYDLNGSRSEFVLDAWGLEGTGNAQLPCDGCVQTFAPSRIQVLIRDAHFLSPNQSAVLRIGAPSREYNGSTLGLRCARDL